MSETDYNKIFDSFNDKNILIIGDVMIDSYMWGNVDRISPEAPVPIIASKNRENRLGGAANVALNISSLGATPILCSVIGDDEKSVLFKELLQKREMTSEGIIKDKDRITTVKTRIISDNQHLLRVDEEITSELSKKTEKIFTQKIISILKTRSVDAIIFEDYDKGSITPYVIKETVQYANENEIPTLVDPKKRNFKKYHNTTLFKPNFKELTEGLKIEIEKGDYQSIHEACKNLQDKLGIKYVFITLSELGVMISYNSTYHHIPAEVRDIADVSGAGDTIISIASLCLASKLTPKEMATISNIAGGLVCERIGVVPVNKEQLLQETKEKLSQ